MTNAVLDEALSLTEVGIAVFPCADNKRPMTPHGHFDASRDPSVVARLWSKFPGPLIGVPTGQRNGFDVLDIDPAGLAWLGHIAPQIPPTLTVETRRRGRHLFFQHAGLRCTAGKLGTGIDTRGQGGYVVWWAAAGGTVLCDAPVVVWPAWLLDKLRRGAAPPIDPITGSNVTPTRRHVEGVVRFIAAAPEGERNAALFWGASRFAEMIGPAFPAFTAARLLIEAAAHTGLPSEEAERTVRSAFKRSGHHA